MREVVFPNTDDGFEARLRRFVLCAFADGVDVEGEWHLPYDDPVTPDLTVVITQVEPPRIGGQESVDDDGFGEELQRFLLREYGEETDIEGTWKLRFAADAVPGWDVTVRVQAIDVSFENGRVNVSPGKNDTR
ncbi:hypothetical protein [Halegenticoccus tardaugens]|uniref:hypothetical protein n=1 Tax=Halegenticoccus tardaugens TaxID=2071624 RepID=UPI00100BC821|nr:hypothetical protein [Halegenticoccus tardaugens]